MMTTSPASLWLGILPAYFCISHRSLYQSGRIINLIYWEGTEMPIAHTRPCRLALRPSEILRGRIACTCHALERANQEIEMRAWVEKQIKAGASATETPNQ